MITQLAFVIAICQVTKWANLNVTQTLNNDSNLISLSSPVSSTPFCPQLFCVLTVLDLLLSCLTQFLPLSLFFPAQCYCPRVTTGRGRKQHYDKII